MTRMFKMVDAPLRCLDQAVLWGQMDMFFIANGKEANTYFTSKKLVHKYGLPDGLSIFLNESAHMDDVTLGKGCCSSCARYPKNACEFITRFLGGG